MYPNTMTYNNTNDIRNRTFGATSDISSGDLLSVANQILKRFNQAELKGDKYIDMFDMIKYSTRGNFFNGQLRGISVSSATATYYLFEQFKKNMQSWDTSKVFASLILGHKYLDLYAYFEKAAILSEDNSIRYFQKGNAVMEGIVTYRPISQIKNASLYFQGFLRYNLAAYLFVVHHYREQFTDWINNLPRELDKQVSKMFNNYWEEQKSRNEVPYIALLDLILSFLAVLYLVDNNLRPAESGIPSLDKINKNSLIRFLYPEEINVITGKTVYVTDDTKVKELEKEIEKWKIKYNQLMKKYQKLNDDFSKAKKEWKIKEQKWQMKENKYSNTNDMLNNLRNDYNSLQNRYDTLEDEKNKLDNIIKEKNKQIADSESTIDELNGQIASLKTASTQNTSDLMRQITDLKTTVSELEKQIATLQLEKQNLENTNKVINKELVTTKNKLDNLIQTINNLKDKISNSLKPPLNNLKNKMTSNTNIVDMIRNSWVDVISSITKTEDELSYKLNKLENDIMQYPDIQDIKSLMDKNIKEAIKDSKAMREFVFKITDNINQILLKGRNLHGSKLMGNSLTTTEQITIDIDNLISEMVLMIEDIAKSPNNMNDKLVELKEYLSKDFRDKVNEKRLLNTERMLNIANQLKEIRENYPTAKEVSEIVDNNLNALVYFFTEKALLAFDKMKNSMFNKG